VNSERLRTNALRPRLRGLLRDDATRISPNLRSNVISEKPSSGSTKRIISNRPAICQPKLQSFQGEILSVFRQAIFLNNRIIEWSNNRMAVAEAVLFCLLAV
jgi:hypothetical protein